jgi:hypothetical protein
MAILPLVAVVLVSAQVAGVDHLRDAVPAVEIHLPVAASRASSAPPHDWGLLQASRQDRGERELFRTLQEAGVLRSFRPRVVCGMTVIAGDSHFDARMRVQDTGKTGATIRSMRPPICNPSTITADTDPPR